MTGVVSFILCAVLCAATIQIAIRNFQSPYNVEMKNCINLFVDAEWQVYTISLTIIIKMVISVTISTVYLQSMETYPTCLRQTGMSLGLILGNLLGISGPYIVYLVRTKD